MNVIHTHVDQEGNIALDPTQRQLLDMNKGASIVLRIKSTLHDMVSTIARVQSLDSSIVVEGFESVATTTLEVDARQKLQALVSAAPIQK